MSEAVAMKRKQKLHYRGRGGQVIIYLGKLLRGFIYQSDWIVLPMAALIAALVSMVVRRDFFQTMEGTLKGAFALTCVSIWNGCFNSIQVVCREREIIKREHRSGLHITAYVFAHMVYQAMLCLGQTAITLYVCKFTGIKFPEKGLFTKWLIVDLGITVFLISYASDMLSLWVSSLTRSTTTAMTVMPFILIFQLVFSGGIFTLPPWAVKLSAISISNYGFKCITAQSNFNELPLVTGWNSIEKVNDQEISTTVTLGQVLDFLQRDDVQMVQDLRAGEFTVPSTEEMLQLLGMTAETPLDPEMPGLADLMPLVESAAAESLAETEPAAPQTVPVGTVIDTFASLPEVQENRDASYLITTTVGDVVDMVGRDKLRENIQSMTAEANKKDDYENTVDNIIGYWAQIGCFIVVCAILSVVFLEFIDKDRR